MRDQSADRKRLRWLLLGLLLTLLVPSSILALRGYQQLGFESLYRYRLTAENIAQSVEAQLAVLLTQESQREAREFNYLLGGADPNQRSPLAALAPPAGLQGAVGYFRIDAGGTLSTPLLPADPRLLVTLPDVEQRQQRQRAIASLISTLADTGGQSPAPLARAELPLPSAAGPGRASYGQSVSRTNQRVFERLAKVGNAQLQESAADTQAVDAAVADQLALEQDFVLSAKKKTGAAPSALAQAPVAASAEVADEGRAKARSRTAQPQAEPMVDAAAAAGQPDRYDWLVESASALEYLSIDQAHFVLYRRAWQEGAPVVLGVMVRREPFLQALIDGPYQRGDTPAELRLTVTEQGQPIRLLQVGSAVQSSSAASRSSAAVSAVAGDELLYRTRLAAPLGDLQLVFSARQLGLPPGGSWIIWSSALLLGLLFVGFATIYRFGTRELARRQTQQDFVSAVSHELKTPLTAIRMYGEMLKSGWVTEEKKPVYYDFIFSESERLSRLISNVLRLSQISRDQLALNLSAQPVSTLMDLARSKLQSMAEQGDVTLHYAVPEALSDAQVSVDEDAFAQVLINLVDNAIKFAANNVEQRVDVTLQGLPSNLPGDRKELCLSVRDFGPGIPKAQLARIFELFYRGESELTRKTQGTGIGLALVAELVAAMNGRIDARNREIGAEFSVYLPLTG